MDNTQQQTEYLFDTHAHYDNSRYDDDRDELLSKMKENGIGYITNIGCTLSTIEKSAEIAKKYDFIYTTAGLHPNDVNDTDNIIGLKDKIKDALANPKCVAVGEFGLDYHYDNDNQTKKKQKYWFETQMELAQEFNLPAIIHDREAHGDCLEIIKKYPKVKGIFHSYSGSCEMARQLLALGWYISFSGVVTFKNAARLPEVVEVVPMDRLLVETDCPYLAPHPNRGERNDSILMKFTAIRLASIKNVSFSQFCLQTTTNAKRIFGIN